MTHAVRGAGLAATLAPVSSLAVGTPAGAQSTSAYVYVQSQGQAGPVYEYSANANGQLTPISGSPFKPGTQIVGGNGSKFFTLGHTLLHSYAVGSNGAIGPQLSQIPVVDYAGSSCGGPQSNANATGAMLDHTGKDIYVMFAPDNCVAYQSYTVQSDGSFTFEGDAEEPQSLYGSELESVRFGLPSILGSGTFAYAEYPNENNSAYQKLIGFRRESSGTLQLMQFSESDPGSSNVWEHDPDASPTGNYVVVQLNTSGSSPTYLASYSVDSQGNLSTTNTFSNMPTTTLVPDWNTMSQNAYHSDSSFSPAGDLFAVYGGGGNQGSTSNGIEIYHFNGAAPLTLYKTLLTGTPIDQVAWDSSNHLYAISNANNHIYVFTVTPSNVTEDGAYTIGSPFSMVVVSQTPAIGGSCAAPSSNGVNVCSPAQGATVSSPVQISAAATVSGGVYRFEVWSGSTKLASVDNGAMNTAVSLAPGSYTLTFDAYNSGKTAHEYATRNITVQ